MRELEDGFKFPGGKVSELTPLAQLAARQGQHIVYIVLITYFWTRFLARGNGFFAIPCLIFHLFILFEFFQSDQ